jgi:hypothetical protein
MVPNFENTSENVNGCFGNFSENTYGNFKNIIGNTYGNFRNVIENLSGNKYMNFGNLNKKEIFPMEDGLTSPRPDTPQMVWRRGGLMEF